MRFGLAWRDGRRRVGAYARIILRAKNYFLPLTCPKEYQISQFELVVLGGCAGTWRGACVQDNRTLFKL